MMRYSACYLALPKEKDTMTTTTQGSPPPTVRIWARNEDEATKMVLSSDGIPELDCGTYAADIGGDALLPFMTAARVIHCPSCGRMMSAAGYSAADHPCIPTGRFGGDGLDTE
jgi:hypothetical protein